jgi:hypothetical protein
MKSYGLRTGVAQFLNMPADKIRVVWMDGPQAYGRTAADDAGFEAAFLAKELGRPVRVQWMRHEETAWDTPGPAFTFSCAAASTPRATVAPITSASTTHVGYNEHDSVLIAQLTGRRRASRRPRVDVDRSTPFPIGASRPTSSVCRSFGNAAAHRQSARPRRPQVTFGSETLSTRWLTKRALTRSPSG